MTSEDPKPNGPADLGWNERSTIRSELRYQIPAGSLERKCTSCKALIYFIVTGSGRRMPVDADGRSHFVTCPNAGQHRKKPAARPRELGAQLSFAPKMPARASDEEE